MATIKHKLKERIKELTCLYEVTSIIVNSDFDQLETSLEAIVHSLKKALQFNNVAEAYLNLEDYSVQTEGFHSKMTIMHADIKVFNKVSGVIEVGYPEDRYFYVDFLEEEKDLLNNVAIAIGSLLERKQIRDSEAKVKRQMERADRLHILGEITAGIAHELNTPLANILGFTELLKERVKDKGALRDLDKIVENAIYSREIVKKLMFFACEMPQEMKMVELNPIVESTLKLLTPSLRAKNIRLTKKISSKSIQLRADKVQLTQVLFNLVMNAIYYSPVKGEVVVSVEEKEKTIQIGISDQGEGIGAQIEDKIFEPFFTTKPLGEGSGLGLSVVHGIISSHRGTIEHRPNKPKGTIFILDFPKL
ncbi:HAMP domain-containing sensor histidine kinase [Zobellia galactanivorans]|uniref:histidine kinase n=1 Tax=Zobellia galactanivorans (strain DSM 12802 / CCUG 47099 / CIP 106680 / NCIMB 13871 / Dsij) TaxID=63186 RepID=G0L8P0_ZOBGA|nr:MULTISPECIES: HAMP domain-containing sensor histidine kinase [Zobellia]MBU3024239.1 HAMP domain-containing histidine kinase [Zobellia galactanivorans]MDO6809690.1 HAMP domain-containing sensor histidine kinase [Zobellia galactanivorans]OWW23290.1 two-component sensor histidine kinase [Zobellia sp. OII3]CAZ97725.1 Two-component system-Sensor histidine kinase [Zobellia galactanivorans]